MYLSECGGFLTSPEGSFSYPNTPGHDQYDHEVSCAWVIRVDGSKVSYRVYFVSVISLSTGSLHLTLKNPCNFRGLHK